ncbi:hypothetical protein F4604DRAFT_1875883 [Suillus subluteus]|nr:hypothetical protein F4604DRAFT_1875883 [Suillus subluteus]
MPVDTSKNFLNAPRRTSRKVANEEETELKRARGEISCAECRRLKLKCDKKVPCGSCVRRGCPTICPNGSLSTGQGTRFVLADTEHLHRTIVEMGQRIRQLEDALSIFQAGVSEEVHPLLIEDLLSIKFGPEALNDGGESNYFGLSAGSEAGAELDGTSFSQPDELPSILPFSLTGIPDHDQYQSILGSLLSLLPPLIDDILSPVYCSCSEETKQECPEHTIAVLYMVFAQGALMDLTLPSCNQEAEDYFHLGRVALSLRSVFESPAIHTVQALARKQYALSSAWSIISLASKLAQSVYRDPSRFNMSPKAVQRRRTLFWEIFSADLFHSLALGHCEFPEDETTTMNDQGEVEIGFWRWKYTFARDVISQIIELTLSAELPSYDTILELDRKVREQALPPPLNLYRSSVRDDYTTPSAYMRGRMLFQFRTTIPTLQSFLAAYRCASAMIKTTVLNFQVFPDLFMRWWPIWSHLVVCSCTQQVIVGSIVTRAPSTTMAPAAWQELNLAMEIFSRGSEDIKSRSSWFVERHLTTKAVYPPSSLEVGGDDELTMFGGQTRVLVTKILSRQNRKKVPSSSSSISCGFITIAIHYKYPLGSLTTAILQIPSLRSIPCLWKFLKMLPPPSMPDPTLGTEDASTTFQTDDALADLFLSGESGMDERWKSFMRDSGIWDGSQSYDLMTDI